MFACSALTSVSRSSRTYLLSFVESSSKTSSDGEKWIRWLFSGVSRPSRWHLPLPIQRSVYNGWRKLIIIHAKLLVQTKSWFEQEPEPALPNYDGIDKDEHTNLSKWIWLMTCRQIEHHQCVGEGERQEKIEAYNKTLDEIRERNRQREHEATFTEIWYTFVDPYATDVDERGSGNYYHASLSPVNGNLR